MTSGHKNHDESQLKENWLFSPNEVSVVGGSQTAKNALIRRLMEVLSRDYRVGRAVNRDRKDTSRADQFAAAELLEREENGSTYYTDAEPDFAVQGALFESCDLVVIDGGGYSDVPTIAVLDEPAESARRASMDRVWNVVAWVGPRTVFARFPEQPHPLFDPSDVEGIAAQTLEVLRARALDRPLYGLVLGGGQSARMGRDKAGLEYHGLPQVRYAVKALEAVCDRTFVSIRAERTNDPLFAGIPQIHDTFLGIGPMGGMLSAFHAFPKAAWLVLGCDLPFVSPETLACLTAGRDPLKFATAFARNDDGLPEPLCAIYEPSYRRRLLQFLAGGRTCPRKALINSRAKILTPNYDWELDNVNEPADYERAVGRLAVAGGQQRRRRR